MPELHHEIPVAARDRAIRRLLAEVSEGLRHGFFEFTVRCEVIGRDRRRFELRAGKNYQFVIPASECDPDSTFPSDPRAAGAPEKTAMTRGIPDIGSTRPVRLAHESGLRSAHVGVW